MKLPFIQWLLQGIPENLAMASLLLSMAGKKLEISKIIKIGVPQAVIFYLVRSLPISFGLHTIIGIVTLAILLNLIAKIKFSKSLFFALLAHIALAIFETVVVGVFIQLSGQTYQDIYENFYLYILLGWPQVIFLFLSALWVNRWRNNHNTGEKD